MESTFDAGIPKEISREERPCRCAFVRAPPLPMPGADGAVDLRIGLLSLYMSLLQCFGGSIRDPVGNRGPPQRGGGVGGIAGGGVRAVVPAY